METEEVMPEMPSLPVPSPTTDDFASALRAAIADRGLSLERIRYHLAMRGHDLSVATLSYWQSGRSRPDRAKSLAALGSIEEVLELPPGELVSLLPARRRRSSEAANRLEGVARLTENGQLVDRLVRQLGLSFDSGLERLAVHDLLEIGRHRNLRSHAVREVLRAEADGVDRWPVWLGLYDDDYTPFVSPTRNCHLGRVIEVPERQLVVAEMILHRPLERGEAVVTEYQFRAHGTDSSFDWWERIFPRRVRETHLEVSFDPEVLPVAAERFTVTDGLRRPEPVLVAGHSVRSLRLDFGPGTTGLSWRW